MARSAGRCRDVFLSVMVGAHTRVRSRSVRVLGCRASLNESLHMDESKRFALGFCVQCSATQCSAAQARGRRVGCCKCGRRRARRSLLDCPRMADQADLLGAARRFGKKPKADENTKPALGDDPGGRSLTAGGSPTADAGWADRCLHEDGFVCQQSVLRDQRRQSSAPPSVRLCNLVPVHV